MKIFSDKHLNKKKLEIETVIKQGEEIMKTLERIEKKIEHRDDPEEQTGD